MRVVSSGSIELTDEDCAQELVGMCVIDCEDRVGNLHKVNNGSRKDCFSEQWLIGRF